MNISFADETIRFDESIAIERAKVELKEFAFLSGYEIEPKYLSGKAKVLAARTKEGAAMIMVLFATDKGTYDVSFGLDKDGWLVRYNVGASIYKIGEIEKLFYQDPSIANPN